MINRPNAEIWTLRHLFRVAVCVLLVACFGAVSAQGESAYADEGRWSRLAGSDAYGTMQAIVQSEWQASDAVVIATFDGYWDALSASALAGVLDAPALFTDRYGLSEATRSEIERLGATHAYVCGGVNAVSDTVVAELDDMGLQVER
ncbi:MAG: cell wall-binding repeat-containing protein, partial [Eggerthellaceae bacterium]|nr:cell wall-binding repeat-containing protein [Eggerthellaceae bacterium]